MRVLLYLAVVILFSACAKVEEHVITIGTSPQGANISIAEKNSKTGGISTKEVGVSPVEYTILPEVTHYNSSSDDDDESFSRRRSKRSIASKSPKYIVTAQKDGFFTEEKSIDDFNVVMRSGTFMLNLHKSPMWWATSESPAVNQWINLMVHSDISNEDMWQRVVDAVTKRYSDLDNYDFKSGYLTTIAKTKSYKSKRGTFLLRSRFIATVMEKSPLTYRIKLDSHWSSGEGVTWHPYPRVFSEDAELIDELIDRFQAY